MLSILSVFALLYLRYCKVFMLHSFACYFPTVEPSKSVTSPVLLGSTTFLLLAAVCGIWWLIINLESGRSQICFSKSVHLDPISDTYRLYTEGSCTLTFSLVPQNYQRFDSQYKILYLNTFYMNCLKVLSRFLIGWILHFLYCIIR